MRNMKKLAIVLAVLAICAMPAMADVYNINVCNSMCPSGSGDPMPMGTMTVTQGVNALNFVFQMNAYGGPNNVQYALGSQGGGYTIALQLNGINLSSITLSNVTATLWQNVSH